MLQVIHPYSPRYHTADSYVHLETIPFSGSCYFLVRMVEKPNVRQVLTSVFRICVRERETRTSNHTQSQVCR